MNILQINNYSYLKGGSEAHFLDLIELLESKGHKVISFCSKTNKKRFVNFKVARRLKKVLEIEKIDIAHIHNINFYLTPIILKVLQKYNIPVVMTTHDYSLISPNYNLSLKRKLTLKSIILYFEFYLRKLFFNYKDLVDVFIAPSEFMAQKLKQKGFENVVTIHNFTNIVNEEIENKNKNYFLYFGRLSSEKGLKEFILTLSKLKRDFNFYIAGQGSQEKELKKIVQNLKLESKIKFLGYQDREKELPKLIREAQFIVIPSRCEENCSLSILEAMNSGKIVLAPDLGGNPELITSKFGFLYNHKNETDLLDRMIFLLDNRKSTLEKNKIIIEVGNKFNSEKYYQKLIEIYKKVINKK